MHVNKKSLSDYVKIESHLIIILPWLYTSNQTIKDLYINFSLEGKEIIGSAMFEEL